ncbi:MAG: hypothetical protein AMJ43_10985 [Coxiella sp. DG_40]|nr:MAG: hypothetical protein AMJ43_10985 [Coxiella sp. DG_40]
MDDKCQAKLSIDCMEYFNMKFDELEARMQMRADAAKDALIKADQIMEHRLEGMNEFRAQLTSQACTFLPRETFEAEHKLLVAKIDATNKILYIGIGIMLVLQIVIKFIV